MDIATDTQIAQFYPAEWARANDPRLSNRSKARNNLRRRYRLVQEHMAFVAANPEARCSGCAHSNLNPSSIKGLVCDLNSDFHGYQMVSPDDVCTRFSPHAAAPVAASTAATLPLADNRAAAVVSTESK
jgi:hypothetical protein